MTAATGQPAGAAGEQTEAPSGGARRRDGRHDTAAAVAEAAWPWRNRSAGAQRGDAWVSRRRALTRSAVGVLVGLTVCLGLGRRLPGSVVIGLSLFLLGLGWFFPRGYRKVDAAMGAFGRAVAVAITWLVLVPFFYVFFTLGRLVLVLGGRDPLTRRFRTGRQSYWCARQADPRPDRWRSQY